MNLNPDTLSGRALDPAVAERVFKLEVEQRTNARTGQVDYVCREPGRDWNRVALYAASLSASSKVELELERRGWKRRERSVSGPATPATVVLVHEDGRTFEAEGASLGAALCRAAVKALRSTAPDD